MIFTNKRKYERFDFARELIVSAEIPGDKRSIEYYAKTINISRGGILFYSIAEFNEKTSCRVNFKSNNSLKVESTGKILREVKENRPDFIKENEHMYALEFSKLVSEDELQKILKTHLEVGAG